jgi:uncharacterized protein YjdB
MRRLNLRRRRRLAAPYALMAVLAACAGSDSATGTTNNPPPPAAVASVRVTGSPTTLEVGSTAQLTATPVDGNGTALANRSVTWTTSSETILGVSGSGLARGMSPGTATATATVEGKSGSLELTIVPPPAIGLATSAVSFAASVGGATPQAQTVAVTNVGGGTLSGLTASVTYGASQPTGWLAATLSGTTAPATLTLAATTGSLAVGTYNATVTIASTVVGEASRTVAVELSVVAAPLIPVASVAVAPPTVSVQVGATAQLTATTHATDGNVLTGRSVSWTSSAEDLAAVSQSGVVTGMAAGSATITATSDGKSGTAVVTITAASPAAVATVAVTPATPSVTVGQTVQLTATLRDAAGNALTGRTVEWSSGNTAVASVSATGLVTGATAGTATITATSGGKSGTAQLTVTQIPIGSIAVAPATASVFVGATVQLTATPRDAAGNPLTGRVVSWTTSSAAVASVSQSGLVTGVAAGSATITATSEGKSGTAQVTVTAAVPQIAGGSIVYIKGGNVWLSDPSGTVRRQVTTDGRYRNPSMADDGTIGVLRDSESSTNVGMEFVRLSPTGTVLGKFTWTFSNTVHRAAISPDGLSFAHIYTSVCAFREGGTRTCLRLAFTPSDRYEEVERTGTFDSWDYVWAAWQTNHRVVITGGYLASPVLTYSAAEIYVRPTGIKVAEAERDPHRLADPDYKTYLAVLTRDGARMVTHRQRFRLEGSTEVLGPHEVAIYRHTGPGQYQAEEAVETAGDPNGLTASPDGKAWAFADGDGVWVHAFGTTEVRLLDPEGRQPSWGAYIMR